MAGPHSFAGATFAILRQGSEERTSEADVSIRRIPGGNLSVIDFGGLQLDKLTVPVWFESAAEYSAFRAKVGALPGTLTWLEGPSTAVLTRLRAGDPYPDGSRDGTAEFTLL